MPRFNCTNRFSDHPVPKQSDNTTATVYNLLPYPSTFLSNWLLDFSDPNYGDTSHLLYLSFLDIFSFHAAISFVDLFMYSPQLQRRNGQRGMIWQTCACNMQRGPQLTKPTKLDILRWNIPWTGTRCSISNVSFVQAAIPSNHRWSKTSKPRALSGRKLQVLAAYNEIEWIAPQYKRAFNFSKIPGWRYKCFRPRYAARASDLCVLKLIIMLSSFVTQQAG